MRRFSCRSGSLGLQVTRLSASGDREPTMGCPLPLEDGRAYRSVETEDIKTEVGDFGHVPHRLVMKGFTNKHKRCIHPFCVPRSIRHSPVAIQPSRKLKPEPHSHHRSPISRCIDNADHQGFKWRKGCYTSTEDVA